jgi:cobalt ECF transporter T component CbiQ
MTAPATPSWLLEGRPAACPCAPSGIRRRAGFVGRTLEGSAGLLRHALFADDVAHRPGLLQRIEPRAKLVSVGVLLVATSMVRHAGLLAVACSATLALAALSSIPLRSFVARAWLSVPIFTGLVVLPAVLSIVTPGQVVVPLGHWFGHPVGVTRQGLAAAILIVLRVTASVSLVVLLTLTTPWNRLLASLRALLVPRPFVQVLTLAHRYLFHLLASVADMFTARRARTVRSGRARTEGAPGRAFVAASAGALFGKAHAMSEEVHQAMVSRGYRGDARALVTQRVAGLDVACVLFCTGVAIALVTGDRSLGA